MSSAERHISSTEATERLSQQIHEEVTLDTLLSDMLLPTTLLNDDTFDVLINEDYYHSPNPALAALTASISNQGVNNISSVQLSVDELRVLALGLNFIFEPNDISNYEIYEALDEYADTLLNKEQLDYTGTYTYTPSDEHITLITLKRRLRKKIQSKREVTRKEYQQREQGYIKSFESNQFPANIRAQFKANISDKRQKTHHQLSKEEKDAINTILTSFEIIN